MTVEADVDVTLGDFTSQLTIAVESGQVLALVGPNGAGKSTLLRAVAGLQPLDHGRIIIDGVVVDDPDSNTLVPPEQRSVGMLFQDYLLFPHLTAVENVAFGLRARGVHRARARDTAAEWLQRLGIADRAVLKPADLSGGQAQRVGLARALAVEPHVLLLDEPLAALDAAARDSVRRDLRRHLREFSGATLLVSHDPVDAAVLADEIAILDDGRIVQRGEVGEVLAHPRTRYVAELAGVNLLEGEARGHEIVLLGGDRVIVADPTHGPVFVVIAPQAISLAIDSPHNSARNHWPARVAGIETIGERARVRLAGSFPLVAEVTTAAVAELGLRDGRSVWASVKATEVRVSPR
jgi:molybdate transport system ATP-binding protein